MSQTRTEQRIVELCEVYGFNPPRVGESRNTFLVKILRLLEHLHLLATKRSGDLQGGAENE